jgi:hypothetical protein
MKKQIPSLFHEFISGNFSLACALLLLAIACSFQQVLAQNYVIGGNSYIACSPSETVVAPFTTTAGGVTTNQYSGLVLLTVSGTGQSAGTSLNDAFYFNIPGSPTHEPNFFQLVTTTGASVFDAPTNPNAAYRHIVYDVDAGIAVTPPYTPAFRTDNTYRFIIDMGTLVPPPAGPSILRLGVNDGVVSDNSGAYTIRVTQLCASCGENNGKVPVCHKGKELCISANALQAHLAHGDVAGPCPPPSARSQDAAASIRQQEDGVPAVKFVVNPNPANGLFTMRLSSLKAANAEVLVFNSMGVTVERRLVQLTGNDQTIKFSLENKPAGFYFVRMITIEGVQISKVLVQK